jgi:hypothetical protein
MGHSMHKGFADEVVVVVKLAADEGRVTYLRVKLLVRGNKCRRRRTEQVIDELLLLEVMFTRYAHPQGLSFGRDV